MKSSKLMIAIAFFILVGAALAQTATLRVKLPFDFNIGQQKLTAGEYRVIVDTHTMRVAPMGGQGVDCGSFAYLSPDSKTDVSPKLIFHRYTSRTEGKRYFLAEVWTGDANRGHKLLISPEEKEYTRLAQAESETVIATRMPN